MRTGMYVCRGVRKNNRSCIIFISTIHGGHDKDRRRGVYVKVGCTVAEVFDGMKLSALKCLFPWQGGLIAPVAKTLGCSHALVAVISALFHILLVGFYFSSSLSII